MNRTLKNAIHKAWEAAHKQGEAFEPDVLTCFDLADEDNKQVVERETRAIKSQHHAHMSPQVLGRTGAPTTIEKAPETPSAVRTEKTYPRALDNH